MRVWISDAGRRGELRSFFRGVHATAVDIDDHHLEVGMINPNDAWTERRQVSAYLQTWLDTYGRGLRASIEADSIE